MIVVDSNVIAYLYLPGEFTGAAERLLAKDPEWHAPILWRSEFRNILAGYMRKRGLTLAQAFAIQQEAQALLHGAEHEPESLRVLELVHASHCSAYDCEFVALAQSLGTTLVTMDAKPIAAFPAIATQLDAV